MGTYDIPSDEIIRAAKATRKRHNFVQDVILVISSLILMAALFAVGGGYV